MSNLSRECDPITIHCFKVNPEITKKRLKIKKRVLPDLKCYYRLKNVYDTEQKNFTLKTSFFSDLETFHEVEQNNLKTYKEDVKILNYDGPIFISEKKIDFNNTLGDKKRKIDLISRTLDKNFDSSKENPVKGSY